MDAKADWGGRWTDARNRPLGAYFRVNHRDLVAMHSAIAEVGILYATATVHSGWDSVGADGLIPWEQRRTGGHAFAIVAYDEQGFWIQNSWGPDWGRKGFATLAAWVCSEQRKQTYASFPSLTRASTWCCRWM